MKQRLSTWRHNNLSIGGRVSLINSTLSAIPLFMLSFYKISKKVAKELIKIQRNFLWGGGDGEKVITWVKWSDVCRGKEDGGLGIKDIYLFNKSLICKWRWRAITEYDALWARVLGSKYGDLTRPQDTCTNHKISQWWREITKLTDNYEMDNWFWSKVICSLGDGKRLKFWQDNWDHNGRLADRFPRLYLLSANKEATVAHMGLWEGSSWKWTLEWSRPIRAWESDMASQLVAACSVCSIRKDTDDVWKWDMGTACSYNVRDVYIRLQSQAGMSCHGKLFTLIWKARVPSKVRILAWRIFHNRIQTRDQLRRRNVLSENEDLACPFCNLEIETSKHLMFECLFSTQVWHRCYGWWGVSQALPNDSFSHFWQHVGVVRSLYVKKVGLVLWFAVIWSLWTCRNRTIFQNTPPCVEEVIDDIILKSWCWISAYSKNSLSFYQWQAQPLMSMKTLT